MRGRPNPKFEYTGHHKEKKTDENFAQKISEIALFQSYKKKNWKKLIRKHETIKYKIWNHLNDKKSLWK